MTRFGLAVQTMFAELTQRCLDAEFDETYDERGVFENLPNPLSVCRYHSLIVEEASLPNELLVTARTSDGVVMAIAHRDSPVEGVQFHPEAVLTQRGYELLANFLAISGIPTNRPNFIAEIRAPTGADTRPELAVPMTL